MKITKSQLRRIIREAQWGRFTGGAAPLDLYDTSDDPVPKDQLKKISDIFINDMGMSPEEVLKNPEFIKAGITDLTQLDEAKMKVTKRQLRQIIREEVGKMQGTLAEGDPRLARIRKQRQTVDNLAAVTSLASLGDTPATGRPADTFDNEWYEQRHAEDQNDMEYYIAVSLENAARANSGVDGQSLLRIARQDPEYSSVLQGVTDERMWEVADTMIEDGTLFFDVEEDAWYYTPEMR
jgi:hypothetical protein